MKGFPGPFRSVIPTAAALVVLLASAVGCSSAEVGGVIRGTASYRERMALPPGAVLEISLRDVSLADAPAAEIASTQIEDPGVPPFVFEIAYDAQAIDPRHAYAVRAAIRSNGRLLFTSDSTYPVLTPEAGDEVDIVLVRVAGGKHEPDSRFPGTFPATFEGELPCADCPGIFYHLDLFEDGVFFLRMTYLGRGAGAIHDSIGSWTLAPENGRLTLFDGGAAPELWRVTGPETIRKLDSEGREIDSELSYDLRRKDAIGTIEPRLTMRGMYRYFADAASFTECLTGRTFPVAAEAGNIALERAYLEARHEPGEELLVSLTARIAARPKMEDDGVELMIVPERFRGVRPGETCESRNLQ